MGNKRRRVGKGKGREGGERGGRGQEEEGEEREGGRRRRGRRRKGGEEGGGERRGDRGMRGEKREEGRRERIGTTSDDRCQCMHGQTWGENTLSHCCCFAHHVEGVRKARIEAGANCVIKIVQLLPSACEVNNGPA